MKNKYGLPQCFTCTSCSKMASARNYKQWGGDCFNHCIYYGYPGCIGAKCRGILIICFQCYPRYGNAGHKSTSFWIGQSRHNNAGPGCTLSWTVFYARPSSNINMHQPAIPALPLNQPFTSEFYLVWGKEKVTICRCIVCVQVGCDRKTCKG